MELANRLAFGRVAELVGKLLARSVRLPEAPLAWRMVHGPYFGNEVAVLELRGREARLQLERTPPQELRRECVLETTLT